MKNLKKVLALVLALMMVMSMMVTASAAKFEDDAEISYLEAVEVMAAAGVLKGYEAEDGTYTFKPEGTLTRAEAAKIIAYVLNGGELDTIAADALVNPFEDVSGWAEPYIAYIASEGIVDGNGGGKYNPKGTLTGYEFAKMLLNVLEIEGTYTGKEWKLNVALNAKDNDLLVGLAKDFALKNDITREEAAQMAFNALQYSATVSYGYPVMDGTGEVLGYFDTLIEAATAASVLSGTYSATPVELPGEALIDGYKLKTTAATIGIGYKGYYWYVDKNNSGTYNSATESIVSSFVCTDTVVGTYTVANTWKQVGAALALTADATVNSYVNGADDADVTIDIDSTSKVLSDSDTTMTVVVRANNTVEILYATEYLATVTVGTKDTDPTSATYGLYPYTFAYNSTTKTVYGAENAYNTNAKYLIVPTTVPTITLAKTVVGAISAIAADTYIRVGADVIYLSDAADDDSLSANVATVKTVYLNSNGDVISVGGYSAAAPVYDGYAYLTDVEYVATGYSATGLVGSGSEASITAKAKIVTPEGETKTVDVATSITASGSSYVVKYYLNGWKTVSSFVEGAVDAMAANSIADQWVAYTEKDGVYSFVLMGTTTLANAANKTATVDIDSTKHFMDANTVINFVDYNTDSKAIETTTVKGYANISALVASAINGTQNAVVVANDTTKVVSSITIYGTTTTTAAVDFAVYAGQLEASGYGSAYDTYGFYVDGALKAYYIESSSVVSGLSAGDIVTFETDADGVVTTATNVTTLTTDFTVTPSVSVAAISADGTYFVDGSNNVVTLGAGYVVYNTAANLYAIDALVAGQTVTTICDYTTGVVLAIFVTAQPSV